MRHLARTTVLLATALLVGAPASAGTRVSGNLVYALSTLAVANPQDARDLAAARRAADAANAHNRKVEAHANGSTIAPVSAPARTETVSSRRGSQGGSVSSSSRSRVSGHARHRGATSRHRSVHRDTHRSHSGVHVDIGGVHIGVGSSHRSYDRSRSYTRNRSYGNTRSYSRSRSYSTCPPPVYHRPSYDPYVYRPVYAPTVVKKEVVVVEREAPTRTVYTPSSNHDVRGLRGWDYLVHGERERAQAFFADLASRYSNEGIPKLGFAMSAFENGDIRNAAHGIRRAFEFDPSVVAEGPGVSGFQSLVGSQLAELRRGIDKGYNITADHWTVNAALQYFAGDYEGAMYSAGSAKAAGDHSRGFKVLELLINEKVQASQMYSSGAR